MALTEEQIQAWLESPTARPVVLVEVTVRSGGVEVVHRLSNRDYTEPGIDDPQTYLSIMEGGISYTEQLSLQGSASLAWGDLELNNLSGEYDYLLDDDWKGGRIVAVLGDVSWVRADFWPIFTGICGGLKTKSPSRLNILLRDMMERLNVPVTDVVLGGSTQNAGQLIPLAVGEVCNGTPLLTNAATNEYQIHSAAVEDIFEVRDSGVPMPITKLLSSGKFRLLSAATAGAITASAQGDVAGGYSNTIAPLVKKIVTGYGNPATRLTDDEIDASNFSAFAAAHPYPVGLYLKDRENVITACGMLAGSVRAQLLPSPFGKLRLLKISLPPVGTPRDINLADYLEGSLARVEEWDRVGSVKLNYCKNWTVQPGLQTGIPQEHKDLFATEWRTVTVINDEVATDFDLSAAPIPRDTMLLRQDDALAVANEELDIVSNRHAVYQITAFRQLLTLQLGDPARLFGLRYGLEEGKVGQVIYRSPDWQTSHVVLRVAI